MLFVPFFRGVSRQLHLACLALAVTAATVFGQTNSISADGFDPNIDGNVYAVARQNDGKLVVAGKFGKVAPNGGQSEIRNNIVRLNADGSIDPSFDPDANGAVRAVVVQSNGKILIGGDFTTVRGKARNYIALLNSDGSVDETFSASIGRSLNPGIAPTTPQVFALAVQSNGSVVVGGTFGSASSSGVAAVQRNNIARFSSTGALDTSYDPSPNGIVLALVIDAQGAAIAGGGFTEFRENGKTTATPRLRAARLLPNGTVDATFDPKADNGITSIALQKDGKILLGGYFKNVQPNGTDAAAARSNLARLNSDGTLDHAFATGATGNVYTIAVSPDGAILLGGNFSAVQGGGLTVTRSYAAKLNEDGSVDEAFNPGLNSDVYAIVAEPDGKVVLGGLFTRALPTTLTTAVVRNHIARVLPNGSLDTAFQLDPGGRILASVTQADGKIVVAGSFTNIGGLTRNYVARLNANGSVDPTYNPNLNGRVYALAYQASDKKVLVGGTFTSAGSQVRNHIARLNEDGTIDASFDPNIDGIVGSIVVQSDGRIIVGGMFNSVRPAGATEATGRANLLRLTREGQLDTGFNPTPNSAVAGIGLQSDGKIVVVGSFSVLQPGASGDIHYRNYIARLNADGSIDPKYAPNANNPVTSVVIQPSDSKAVIGGQFTALFPENSPSAERKYLARLNADGSIDMDFNPRLDASVIALGIQPDGSILVGGRFTTFQPNDDTSTTTRRYVARLTSAGNVDPNFDLKLNESPGNRVDSISLTTGNDILIGGIFTSVGEMPRSQFARIKTGGTLDQQFVAGAGTVSDAKVAAVAVQPDGQIIIGGNFSDLGGASSTDIARFTPEGTPDHAFNAALSTDGTVNAVAVRPAGAVPTPLGGFAWLNTDGTPRTSFSPSIGTRGRINASVMQPDGKIIIAGQFADITSGKNNIIRLTPTGAVDGTFAVTVNGAINAMALRNGKLIIVGAFTTVNGTTRNRVARIDANGTLDSFDPNADAAVNAVVIQQDGAVILGGSFTTLTAAPATSAVTRTYVARVNADGALDTAYNPNVNAPVYALALDGSGRLIAGGAFTAVQPNSDTSATARNRIARFETNGNVDKSFDPNANDAVYAIVRSGDSMYLGGAFTTLQPTVGGTAQSASTRRSLARIGTTGAVDTAFSPGTNGSVTSMALTSDGALLIGGTFNAITATGSNTPIARNHLARLTGAGALDGQFNPNVAGSVDSVVIAEDGSVLIGGSFTSLQPRGVVVLGGSFRNVGGVPVSNLAQLNGDGSVDATFQPNPDDAVTALLTLSDGRLIIGGAFTRISGTTRNGIARFNADSTFDSGFAPSFPGGVATLALQSDGKVLVGTAGTSGLIRLNADGSQDTGFNVTAPFFPARAIAVQPDGRIVVAGPGSGVPTRILRLNADGSADTTFSTVSFTGPSDVRALLVQSDGSIIVGGSFTSIGGANIARLARLTPSGAVDTTFNPAPNGTVTSLAFQPDGRLVVGGEFTVLGGLQHVGVGRLNLGRTPGSTNGTTSPAAAGLLANLATRGTVKPGSPLISGFSITGTNARTVLIRAIGPGLAAFNVTDALQNPQLRLYSSTGAMIGSNDGWNGEPALAAVFARTGAFPLASGSSDAAMVLTLNPGTYSVQVVDGGSSSTGGTALLEVYDAGTLADPTARLTNLSSRATVPANGTLIGGLVVDGYAPRTLLIRGVGPSLAKYGVTETLADPRIAVHNGEGAVIAVNDDWTRSSAGLTDAEQAAEVRQASAATGAFAYDAGSRDAALVVTVPAGVYTIQVSGAAGAGGAAMIEVYELQ